MYDTNVTLVGNLLNAPEWRRTANTGSLVAHFRVASTARRFDRSTGRWVDGNSLRVRVSCWRRLAEGVASSLMTGDPVIVVGRLYTRDWTDAEGQHRTMYELEAVAVGHDLGRGRSRFVRNRPSPTSAIEDAEADSIINGEATELVPGGEAPVRREEAMFDDEDGPGGLPAALPGAYDPLAGLRADFPSARGGAVLEVEDLDPGALDEAPDEAPESASSGDGTEAGGAEGDGTEGGGMEAPGTEAGATETVAPPARGRRSRSRATAGV
ncbi:single-stranded DNA-binding protein [Rhizomonospora bruguierae]|uniref:single-stranded DNA-binding protein n=1 Tax=Rhizomonospora bruguierae TaxID=1581705 RepID=UPI001BD047C1|nr:single-stranded DNA-binding protein [Micromonospora sp. NBRC 107566]